MNKLTKLFLSCCAIVMSLSFASCSDDDEPANGDSGAYGIWISDDKDGWPVLMTSECWIWDDDNLGAQGFVPYQKASYLELAKVFAPDDEFCVYYYDSKNDIYIVYSNVWHSGPEVQNLKYNVRSLLLMKIKVQDNVMTVTSYHFDNQEDYDFLEIEDGVTYETLKGDKRYQQLPDGAVLSKGLSETFHRYKGK